VKAGRGRKNFDPQKMIELQGSIAKYGVLQPVVLTEEEIEGVKKIVLIAGERRLLASLQLGKTEIPYIWKKDVTPIIQKQMELEENIMRQDMDWSERNEMIRQIVELEKLEKGTTRNDPNAFKFENLAARVGEAKASLIVKANFAEECAARPDIFEQVKHMPMATAMSKFKQIVTSETTEAAMKAGDIKLNQAFINGDTRALIKQLPNEFVDLLLSDMPFGIPDLEGNHGSNKNYTQMLKRTDNLTSDEMKLMITELAPQWFRVLKPNAHIWLFFGWDFYDHLYNEMTKAGFIMEREPTIWDKMSTTGAFLGYDGAPCYEQILVGHKPPRKKMMHDSFKKIISYKPVAKTMRSHPFEKPLDLLCFIIKQSTKLGDVVLDSFGGTASVAIAAEQLGRSSVVHELDKDHFNIGQKRLSEQAKKAQA
jgi:DNA modification methylase